MIAAPPGVRILLAAKPVDFRKGMDGLAALVQRNRCLSGTLRVG
jgi:transposase